MVVGRHQVDTYAVAERPAAGLGTVSDKRIPTGSATFGGTCRCLRLRTTYQFSRCRIACVRHHLLVPVSLRRRSLGSDLRARCAGPDSKVRREWWRAGRRRPDPGLLSFGRCRHICFCLACDSWRNLGDDRCDWSPANAKSLAPLNCWILSANKGLPNRSLRSGGPVYEAAGFVLGCRLDTDPRPLLFRMSQTSRPESSLSSDGAD